jgi:hypothetical protein
MIIENGSVYHQCHKYNSDAQSNLIHISITPTLLDPDYVNIRHIKSKEIINPNTGNHLYVFSVVIYQLLFITILALYSSGFV